MAAADRRPLKAAEEWNANICLWVVGGWVCFLLKGDEKRERNTRRKKQKLEVTIFLQLKLVKKLRQTG